jgi:hypothetical protein
MPLQRLKPRPRPNVEPSQAPNRQRRRPRDSNHADPGRQRFSVALRRRIVLRNRVSTTKSRNKRFVGDADIANAA